MVIIFAYIILIVLFTIVFAALGSVWLLHEDYREEKAPEKKYLVIVGQWGMANRLRTYNVGYEIARRSGRELIGVNDKADTSAYKSFWGGEWSQIVSMPIRIVDGTFIEDKDIVYIGNENEDCGVTLTLADDVLSEPKASIQYIGIDSCEIVVPDMTVSNAFYAMMRPTDAVMALIKDTLDTIHSHDLVVGVHIRQGNISDFHQEYFFGDWKHGEDEGLPLMCCHEDAAKNMSSCPEQVVGIEKYVDAMRGEPDHARFFVCSDRPGCILAMEQAFPGRLIYNAITIEHDVDFVRGFCDWWCLAHCTKLLLSSASSFSIEAAKVRGLEATYL